MPPSQLWTLLPHRIRPTLLEPLSYSQIRYRGCDTRLFLLTIFHSTECRGFLANLRATGLVIHIEALDSLTLTESSIASISARIQPVVSRTHASCHSSASKLPWIYNPQVLFYTSVTYIKITSGQFISRLNSDISYHLGITSM